MLAHILPENLIYIDIETVPGYQNLSSLPADLRALFLHKTARLRKENVSDEEHYFNNAGIYAEFGKVVCITVGVLRKENEVYQLRIKTYSGIDEKSILSDFAELLNKSFTDNNKYQFCGHNIREFDIPYLCRRMLINQIALPAMLDVSSKKPYEQFAVDTLQLWRFGDYKNYTSLQLLTTVLGIDSPKDDMSGSEVGKVFWMDNNIERIVAYNQKDVIAVVKLILRFKGFPGFLDLKISIV
jgi:3'-5' exonuclease